MPSEVKVIFRTNKSDVDNFDQKLSKKTTRSLVLRAMMKMYVDTTDIREKVDKYVQKHASLILS